MAPSFIDYVRKRNFSIPSIFNPYVSRRVERSTSVCLSMHPIRNRKRKKNAFVLILASLYKMGQSFEIRRYNRTLRDDFVNI